MKKYSKLKYIIRGLFTFIFAFGVIFNSDVYAQEVTQRTAKGTQISDDSTPNSLDPLSFSLLDLSSTERGFLMPRLTTGQRDNIPKQSLTAGLVIYNTTIGCIEFYNTNRQLWMNMCGDVEPAVFTIPLDKCNELKDKISGDYIQGVLLNERRNIISLEVNVSTPGTFEIEAIAYTTTGAENGYSFTARGVFPSSGNFLLVLKGSGTPKVGSADTNVKDTIKFFLNKKEVTCQVQNHVKPDFEPLQAAFVCNDANNKITVEGKYKVDEPLSSANRIIVPFKVTKPGRGKVFGEISKSGKQTEVIKYESEMIDFRVTDVDRVQTVALYPVYGTGKPTTSGKLTGKLELRSNGKHDYDPFVDPVAAVVESSCGFTIDVESDFANIAFSSNMVFQSDLMSKTDPSHSFYIPPHTKMGKNGDSRFKMLIELHVESPGDFEIKTKEVNGIWFEASGTIPSTYKPGSTYYAELIAFGKSGNFTPVNRPAYYIASITNYGSPLPGNTGPVPVEFVYEPMRLLSIGGQSWHPNGKYTAGDVTYDALHYMLSNPQFFAWNGDVRVDGLTYFGPKTSGDIFTEPLAMMGTNTASLESSLRNADMVFIGGLHRQTPINFAFTKSDAALQVLVDYLKKDGGVLVYGESTGSQMLTFTSKLGHSLFPSTVSYNEGKDAAKFVGSNELIKGDGINYFGKYSGISLSGRNIGGSYHTTTEGKDSNIRFSALQGGYEELATYNTGGGAFALLNQKYSFVAVGSDLFMGGYRTNDYTHADGYPVRVHRNGPNDKEPLAGPLSNKEKVYNSWFVLNLIHWAIDEAQKNKTKNRN